MSVDKTCTLCRSGNESLPHIFLHCEVATHLWKSLNFDTTALSCDNINWLDAIKHSNPLVPSNIINWNHLPPFLLWNIWINRNYDLENNTTNIISLPRIINQVSEFHYLTERESNQDLRLSCSTNWRKPPIGWYKLNLDGAHNKATSGIGGVVRGHNGQWILGFNMRVHAASYTYAELLAFEQSLKFAIERNLLPLEIESDSIQVLQLLLLTLLFITAGGYCPGRRRS